MKFMQEAVAQVEAPAETLIKKLIKDVSGYQEARSHKTVHASDITKESFCPRQSALLDVSGGKKKDEYISTPLAVTFDVGNALSDLFRERWASKWTYGDWECAICGAQRTFSLKPKPGPCPLNPKKSCLWKYKEMNFISQKYDISGSLDAVCDLGSPKLFVVEIKIMTPVDFEKIIAPLPEHRIRTGLYMKLIEESSSPYKNRLNLQRGKVLYISRAWGKMHPGYNEILPFKEYDVERDDAVLAPYLSKATAVQQWKSNKKMPSGVCPTSADPKAKKCAVCAMCFSGKFPAAL